MKFHEQAKKWLPALAVLAFAVLMMTQEPPQKTDPLRQEILGRSGNYIEIFGEKPLESLGTEQQLLLLHSYYNLKDYARVLEVAEAVGPAWDTLPPERRRAFEAMIREARDKVKT